MITLKKKFLKLLLKQLKSIINHSQGNAVILPISCPKEVLKYLVSSSLHHYCSNNVNLHSFNLTDVGNF